MWKNYDPCILRGKNMVFTWKTIKITYCTNEFSALQSQIPVATENNYSLRLTAHWNHSKWKYVFANVDSIEERKDEKKYTQTNLIHTVDKRLFWIDWLTQSLQNEYWKEDKKPTQQILAISWLIPCVLQNASPMR